MENTFNADHGIRIPTEGFNQNRLYAAAYSAINHLGWKQVELSRAHFLLEVEPDSDDFWGQEIKISFYSNAVIVETRTKQEESLRKGVRTEDVERFAADFTSRLESMTDEEVEDEYTAAKKAFAKFAKETGVPGARMGLKDTLSLLVPSKGYKVTPVIIAINVLIFIAMIATGVHILNPSVESLLSWGANFKPAIVEGEWWRMFTSMFLHIGILHLLFNMYALLYVGSMLEPVIGHKRFLVSYLLTGLVASITSLFWNDFSVGAGASGAIFGMYGVFIALLTSNLLEKSFRKELLASMGLFVMYNLFYGMKDGIDNAAHIGGLVSGVVMGYAMLPSVRKSTEKSLEWLTLAVMIIVIGVGAIVAIPKLNNDMAKYQNALETFSKNEMAALRVFELPDTTSKPIMLSYLRDTGTYYWNENAKLLGEFDQLDLPDMAVDQKDKLKQYCQLRLKEFELIAKSIEEETRIYDTEIQETRNKINAVIESLGAAE